MTKGAKHNMKTDLLTGISKKRNPFLNHYKHIFLLQVTVANPFVYADGLMPCALVLSCASSFLVRTIAAMQLPLRGWLLLH